MSQNFGRKLFKLGGESKNKKVALQWLEKWAKIPHARWIPYDSLNVTGYGEMTQRQADWIVMQVKRKGKVTISLDLVSEQTS